MAPVRGTHGVPYDFGETGVVRRVNIRDFAIRQYAVTGALWEHVMGADTNTSARGGAGLPLENVSCQLGLFDMSGNVWEWCQDDYTPDVTSIPANGTAFAGTADERVLRGGRFNNWAIHYTVSKRYNIAPDFHDGCIGFRVVIGT
jgi:formylglycine-generating enzyme required for sulfatase activity